MHKDMFGREIKVGDYIVYGAVDGRSGTLRAGQVIALKESTDYRGEVVPKVFAKSWSNFNAERTYGSNPGKGRQKNVTLSFLDRLIVVPEDYVMQSIKEEFADGV